MKRLDYRLFLGFLALGWLGGCSYYTQLGQGQLALLWARQPVSELLADPALDPALKARLRHSQAARDFASDHLALPSNASYRSYVALKRPFVVWNVFATEAFSVEANTRCFPIAGCVAYQGYFNQSEAEARARQLRQAGKDVYLAGVDAYSTLGWFADPLLSTMFRRSDGQLAGLIFHELAHQRLYVPGDTAFNESYARFVERQGLDQWRHYQGLAPMDPHRRQARHQVVRLILKTREHLRQLYASPLTEAAMRQGKAEHFAKLRADYAQLREAGLPGDFDRWFQQPLNNATLLPFGLYDHWVPAFAQLFRQQNCQWPAFHQAVARLAERSRTERIARLQRLQQIAQDHPPQCMMPSPRETGL